MDCRHLRAWGSLMSTDQSRIIYPSNKMAEDSDVLFYLSFQNGLKIQHLYHQHTCLPQTPIFYLLQLLPYFRYWNATGLLIEYADTFPYDGELQVIQGPDAYR